MVGVQGVIEPAGSTAPGNGLDQLLWAGSSSFFLNAVSVHPGTLKRMATISLPCQKALCDFKSHGEEWDKGQAIAYVLFQEPILLSCFSKSSQQRALCYQSAAGVLLFYPDRNRKREKGSFFTIGGSGLLSVTGPWTRLINRLRGLWLCV
jgi:hypothetical protein